MKEPNEGVTTKPEQNALGDVGAMPTAFHLVPLVDSPTILKPFPRHARRIQSEAFCLKDPSV